MLKNTASSTVYTSLFQPATVTAPKQPEPKGDSSMEGPSAEEQRIILEELALWDFEPKHHLFKDTLSKLIKEKSQFEPHMLHLAWSPHAETHGHPSHLDILYVAATVPEFYHYLNDIIGKKQKVQHATVDSFLNVIQDIFCKKHVADYQKLCLPFCIAEELTYFIEDLLDKQKLESKSYPEILENKKITTRYLTPLLNLVKHTGSARAFSLLAQFFIDLLGEKKSHGNLHQLHIHFETEYKATGAEKKLGAYARFYRLYFLSDSLIVVDLNDFRKKPMEELEFFFNIKELFQQEFTYLSQEENRCSPVCHKATLEEQYKKYIASPILRILMDICARLTEVHTERKMQLAAF